MSAPATVWALTWSNLSLAPSGGTTDGLIAAGTRGVLINVEVLGCLPHVLMIEDSGSISLGAAVSSLLFELPQSRAAGRAFVCSLSCPFF
jgi:hypothetical protein